MCLLGAISAGVQGGPERAALTTFGAEIGLAFQIQDDILDVEGTTQSLGKRTGADADRVKPTYPSVLGVEQARVQALARRDRAKAALAPLGPRFAHLGEFADFSVSRLKVSQPPAASSSTLSLRGHACTTSPAMSTADFAAAALHPIPRLTFAPLPRTSWARCAARLRDYVITPSGRHRGGHFAAGLGTVELTAAPYVDELKKNEQRIRGRQAYPQ